MDAQHLKITRLTSGAMTHIPKVQRNSDGTASNICPVVKGSPSHAAIGWSPGSSLRQQRITLFKNQKNNRISFTPSIIRKW